MYTDSIFIFGSTLFSEIKQDPITSLPIEMAWKIFAFLDDASLRSASKTVKTWSRIIAANTKLRKRVSIFELGLKLGSHHLARYHKDNRKRMKMLKEQKYLPVYENRMYPVEIKQFGSKRGGDDLVICAKRFKLT
ncbi:uncharacterized protein [Choristoneura fumiferana]|uniref:uncharacterized protein n=1 Tax=Choristoneura fumiferana TaxID=7141 RepID=UPI003D1583D9